jgi:Flp pilus assembly protein TadG
MLGLVRRLWRSTDGAVAPMVALSLVGLIAAGGLAFDYAHLAAMDTELQQAADQAALAAATQLDHGDDAQTRATTAIEDADNSHRLAHNFTKFASDGTDATVQIASIKFCSAFDDSVADTNAACTTTTKGSDSTFVIVTTELRTADYAFTPIVGVFFGTSSSSAVASVQSSICNVAPLLVCAPNNDFPTDSDVGKGMVMKVAGGNSWAPGNYGYLDFGNGNQAVLNALLANGLNGCQNTGATQTEPGDKNATDAINTRMDVYGGTGATKSPSICDPATGSGCPAPNTRKDMSLTMTYTQQTAKTVTTAPADNQSCGASGGTVSYATSFNPPDASAEGFPRDSCHYSGTCPDGNFGDKNWDLAGYLAANHPGVTAGQIAGALTASGITATAATLTRYNVYTWEEQTAGATDPQQIGTTKVTSKTQGQNTNWTYTKQCTFSQPKLATTSYPAQKDRRVLPIVAADCSNLKGKGNAFVDFNILRVFDVFLTEPSETRSSPPYPGTQGTDDKEIYGEVIGPAQTFAGSNGFQYYSRNKPYLVR